VSFKTILKLAGRRKWLIAGLIIGVVIIWVIVRSVTGPAEGVISPAAAPLNSSDQSDSTYIRHDGKYGSFAYPETYTLENGGTAVSILEAYQVVSPARSGNPTWRINITVYKLPSAYTEDNSAYKIRNNDPSTYIKTQKTFHDQTVIYFKNRASTETVAFIRHNDKLAAFAISLVAPNSSATSDFSRLIESWQWL
jgi:hypothetical protein